MNHLKVKIAQVHLLMIPIIITMYLDNFLGIMKETRPYQAKVMAYFEASHNFSRNKISDQLMKL